MHDHSVPIPIFAAREGRSRPRRPAASRFGLLLAVLVLALAPSLSHAQRGVGISFLQDPSATFSVADAASPEKAPAYQPYIPSFLAFSRLPDSFNGALWLRIAVDRSFEQPAGPVRVNLGSTLPGVTRLFLPKIDGGFSVMESLPSQGVFTLPADGPLPELLYARLDGIPGLWFRPVLETAPGPLNDVPLPMVLAGIFVLAMVILLIRYVRKAEQWRLWAALTAGCGTLAAVLPSTPAAGAATTPMAALAMLAPGLVILFFVHTARHMLRSPQTMPGYDRVFFAYYLLGGMIALLPLIPGYLWTSRYLPLAWIVLLPLIPAAMVAVARSLRGSLAFLAACLLAVGGVVASGIQLYSTGPTLLYGTEGLWGMAIGLVFLSLAGPAKPETQEEAEDVFDSLSRDGLSLDRVPDGPGPDHALPETPSSDADPVPGEDEDQAAAEFPHLALFDGQAEEPLPEETPAEGAGLLVEPVGLRDSRPAPEKLVPIEPDPLEADSPDPDPQEPAGAPFMAQPPLGHGRKTVFDLPTLIRTAYEGPSRIAEAKNLGMSWFIAPQTGRLFEGEADLLDSALRLLLRDMVESLDKGNVRLNVRRLPDSGDAGHIVFSVIEADTRAASHPRNMAGLAEAWSLAEKTNGIFSVEHSPAGGTTVIFSAVFTCLDKPGEDVPEADFRLPGGAAPTSVPVFRDYPDLAVPAPDADAPLPPPASGLDADALGDEGPSERVHSRVIIADTTASGRARTSAALQEENLQVLECVSPAAAVALHARHPSGMVVMNGDMPEVDIVAAITDIRTADEAHGRPRSMVLIQVEHPLQANRMMEAGADRTLDKPLVAEDLLAVVRELLGIDRPHPDQTLPPVLIVGAPDPAGHSVDASVEDETAGAPPATASSGIDEDGQSPASRPISVPPTGADDPVVRALAVAESEIAAVAKAFGAQPDTPAPQDPEEVTPEAPAILPVLATVTSEPDATPSGPDHPLSLDPPVDDSTLGGEIPAGEASPSKTPGDAATVSPPEPADKLEANLVPPSVTPDAAGPGAQPQAASGDADTAPRKNGPSLALLDMIITDEAPAEGEPAAEAKPRSTKVSVKAKAAAKPAIRATVETNQPTVPAMGKERGVVVKPETDAANKPVTPAKRMQTTASVSQPERGTEKPAKTRTLTASVAQRPGQAERRPAPTLADPEPVKSEETPVLVNDMGDGDFSAASPEGFSGQSLPLPGEDDSVYKDMLPLVPGLLHELADALSDAARGRDEKKPLLVQEAAERVAAKAEAFGLTKLERIARCVERAAAADDIEPMECVLTDLENWVARYKEALTKLHRDMQW